MRKPSLHCRAPVARSCTSLCLDAPRLVALDTEADQGGMDCRFFTVKHGTRIFYESGTSGKKLPWSYDEQLFMRWRDGKTGMPLVDANMREIKQTGMPLSTFSRLTHVLCFHCMLGWCAYC